MGILLSSDVLCGQRLCLVKGSEFLYFTDIFNDRYRNKKDFLLTVSGGKSYIKGKFQSPRHFCWSRFLLWIVSIYLSIIKGIEKYFSCKYMTATEMSRENPLLTSPLISTNEFYSRIKSILVISWDNKNINYLEQYITLKVIVHPFISCIEIYCLLTFIISGNVKVNIRLTKLWDYN